MKKLIFALLCTAIGFSATANTTKPVKTETSHTVSVKMSTSNTKKSSFVKYASWLYQDSCGNSLTIVVEAPNDTPRWKMLQAANAHFLSKLDDHLCM